MLQSIFNIGLVIFLLLLINILISIYSNSKKEKLLKEQKELQNNLRRNIYNYGLSLELSKKVGLLLSAIPLDKILNSVSEDMKDDIELHMEELLSLLSQFEE